MKKKLKKLLSLAIVTVLILSFSIVPALATENPPTTWTATSTTAEATMKTITANTISESGVTVTAYQIVKGTYKDGKLTGYTLCNGLSSIPNINSFDYVSPTAYWITTIANKIQNGDVTLASIQMTNSEIYTSTYTAEVEAGEYIILVTNSNAIIYNPAVVAVNVTNANLIDSSSSGGTVDMTSQFSAGDTAYMKSSSPIINKVIQSNGLVRNTASVGKDIGFSLGYNDYYYSWMRIPSYSADYTSVEYTITDDLYLDHTADPPFLGVNGLTVKVSDTDNLTAEDIVTPGENTYAVYYYDSNNAIINWDNENDEIIYNPTAESLTQAVKYKIEFAEAFIRSNGRNYLEIDYSTTLTDNAKVAISDYSHGFVSNNTRATLRYSNDPTDDPNNQTPYNEISTETRTYTFGIDSGNGSIQTYELNKVNQAGGTYTSVLDNNDQEITKKSPNALAGATFTLYSDSAMTQDQDHIIGTATSDANGHIEFRGLAEGTYYFKETAAPSGYTLNDTNYKVVISTSWAWDYFDSYTVTITTNDYRNMQVGSATYAVDDFANPTSITPAVTPAEIVNTQLATLPTTGGMGTIIITIIAGIGMAVFLTIFIVSKKRNSKKN